MKNKKVIVAGHICLDITPIFPEKAVGAAGGLLQPGKLIEMKNADVHTGGSVANTGLAMKILGADVSLKGKVGADEFGELIGNILEKYNARDGLIISGEDSTSYSVVLAIPGVDRIFLHHPGANHSFCADDIPVEELEAASLLHFGYPPLMRSMYENGGMELIHLLKKAKRAGCATSLDMAAVDPASEAGKVDWDLLLQKIIPDIDFFVPSVEELCFMLEPERFALWQTRADGRDITEIIDIDSDVKPLAKKCLDYGAKVLLIKCGAAGIYFCTAQSERLQGLADVLDLNLGDWSGKEGFESSYVPEKVLSGTGAGDTCIAAFLTAVLQGFALEDCMHLAAAEGASCVEAYDALSGLRSLDALRDKIARGWKKKC